MQTDPFKLKHAPELKAALGLSVDQSKVLVIGLGLTGLSVARFLDSRGIDVAVIDSRNNPPCLTELNEWNAEIPVFLGNMDRELFKVATHLMVSPGLALESEEIVQALESGLRLISDIDLFSAIADAPVVGITGSNGKSTVTSLVGMMAEKAEWKVRVGGNLGVPALDLLDTKDSPDLYVLELSSFQLERTTSFQCEAATVLNISPDHLDRHGTIESYTQAKQRIFRDCSIVVLNRDDPRVAAMETEDQPTIRFGLGKDENLDFSVRECADGEWIVHRGKPLIRSDSLKIRGRHNLSNALAALALGEAVGLPMQARLRALQVFPGIPHRMQWIETADGITWINDSKATNVGACIAALNGLTGKVVLIAGGDGKGADFSPLKPPVKQRARAVLLIGKDSDQLHALLNSEVTTIKAANLDRAVELAFELAQTGDTVILSPACASLDQFADYRERGRIFENAVRERIRAH